jgi:diphthamide synthase (EF-2-diphthine--ammonia ligase)
MLIFGGKDTSLNLPEGMKENHEIFQEVALMHRLK